jgi:hypothetical protein
MKRAIKATGDNTLITTIPMSNGRELRIELSRFKGGNYAAMRVWAKQDIGGPLKPVSNQGINFSAELVPVIVNSLEQLEQLVRFEGSQGGLDFGKAANDKWRD